MAWDSSRPVPWTRLVREWLIYVAIMTAVVLVFMRDRALAGIFGGLLVSGPLYLGFGALLAKFGYTRKTMKELRADGPDRGSRSGRSDDAGGEPTGPRPKPAPTSRTGGGAQRPGGSRKKRR